MRRRWTITLLLLAAIVVVVALVAYWHHTVPSSQCSAFYRHYENNPHLSVTYIKDFPIDDTLTVDVTTISALDAAGWDTLAKDFRIEPLPDILQKKLNEGKDLVTTFLAPKVNPALSMDTTDLLKNNVVGISQLMHTVSVFSIETESQINAVVNYNLKL
ncbi:MAG: hypothetical protein IKN29_06245 [Bacteroidales bacterium]|nr:hypothetical protein [Bacteroidales bacterium]